MHRFVFRDTSYETPERTWYQVMDWDVNNKSILFIDSKYQALIKRAERMELMQCGLKQRRWVC